MEDQKPLESLTIIREQLLKHRQSGDRAVEVPNRNSRQQRLPGCWQSRVERSSDGVGSNRARRDNRSIAPLRFLNPSDTPPGQANDRPFSAPFQGVSSKLRMFGLRALSP
jgi:hypothetical protein